MITSILGERENYSKPNNIPGIYSKEKSPELSR